MVIAAKGKITPGPPDREPLIAVDFWAGTGVLPTIWLGRRAAWGAATFGRRRGFFIVNFSTSGRN